MSALSSVPVLLALVMGALAPPSVSADPLADAFGTQPALRGVRLSPDGTKISFLRVHAADTPIAVVFDMVTSKSAMVLASDKGRFEINECTWANAERLLCGFYGMDHRFGQLIPLTRLVAVNVDGSNMKVLMQSKLDELQVQYQDQVVDLLPDDPEHILIEMPDEKGTGVSRLNIYSNRTALEVRSRANVYTWISDGRGAPRLRMSLTEHDHRWWYTLSGESRWLSLHSGKVKDLSDDYLPVGFADDPNSLLILKPSGNRLALWSEDLANDRKSELVFSHPEVDIDDVVSIGKYKRIVAVSYSTDRPHLHFFDPTVEKISARISRLFPNELVQVLDESWNRRYYLVHISSDQNPGMYYRFDNKGSELASISPEYPKLEGRVLAPMHPIHHTARDGAEIPAYVTTPAGVASSKLPAVILPHGGPHARDYWGFSWLPQYFAARGFVVLQSNYRGSAGFGADWLGKGAYRSWRTAIDDIDGGLQHLIDSGLVDPERVCIVGWSYGGYAALMSAAEHPERYQCVVSIAGVTDLGRLIEDARRFIGGRSMTTYIGWSKDVQVEGSPVERADDIQAPVLLFHGDLDINVDVKHSRMMAKALKKKKKDFEFIEYEDVEHSIVRNEYRIDMLRRIGAFLDENTRPVVSAK